jgi:hypothetical protein
MATARISVVVEVSHQPLTIVLERPAQFESLASFISAAYSHALQIVRHRGLGREDRAQLEELGDEGALLQAALTDHARVAWLDDGQLNTHWLNRQPIGDQLFFRILQFGGVREVKRILAAYRSLYDKG